MKYTYKNTALNAAYMVRTESGALIKFPPNTTLELKERLENCPGHIEDLNPAPKKAAPKKAASKKAKKKTLKEAILPEKKVEEIVNDETPKATD